jgi:hypothetical protein
MKTNNFINTKLRMLFTLCFLIFTSMTFSQKNNQKIYINKGIKIVPKESTINCDNNSIDFKVKIIKLSSTNKIRTYKLQLIDFVNKNNCPIKFFNLNWKGQQMVPFSSMRNQNFEKADDDSVGLYEFEFDTKTTAIEPEDGTPISTSILIKIGEKSCFIRDKQATYYNRM